MIFTSRTDTSYYAYLSSTVSPIEVRCNFLFLKPNAYSLVYGPPHEDNSLDLESRLQKSGCTQSLFEILPDVIEQFIDAHPNATIYFEPASPLHKIFYKKEMIRLNDKWSDKYLITGHINDEYQHVMPGLDYAYYCISHRNN